MTRIGVIGATGYTGAELVRILCGHPYIELTILTSRQHAGVAYDAIYPSFRKVTRLVCEDMSLDRICDKSDVVFTALPHKLPMTMVPELLNRGKRVIDLSADFRFADASIYESFYDAHQAKELLEKSVYGLCEIYFKRIRNAALIGAPGCYPTSVLLPLIPLIKSKLIDKDSIIADSKSGVSGAGRSLSLTSHFCEANESFKAYKVAAHRHNPEMEMILSREAGSAVTLTFVPHLIPMTRGILTTIYAGLKQKVSRKDIFDCMNSFYADAPFIRLFNDDRTPDTRHVRGSNYCDIGFKLDQRNRRLILISAIDNLVKGASGQAVQNMNIMLGLDETAGLMGVSFPV